MDRSLRKYRRADWNGRRQRWSQEQLCFAERGQSYRGSFGQQEYEEEHWRYGDAVIGGYDGYEDGVTDGYNGYEDKRGAFGYESQTYGADGNYDNQEYSGYFEESSGYADHGFGITASDCGDSGYLRYAENGGYADHVPKSKANSSHEAGSDYDGFEYLKNSGETSGYRNHFISNSNNREKSNNKNTSQKKSRSQKKKAVCRHQVNRKKSSKMMALAMKRRTRRKKIQKFMVVMLVVFAFCSGFFGRTLFDAYAKEENDNAPIPYYTSIQLAPGDNLWNIASRYAEENGYTVTEYVEELKRMNGLTDGHVHSGEYLTIVYFPE